MLSRIFLALLLAAAPSLALGQSRGSPRYDGITVDGAATLGSVVTPSLTLGGSALSGVGTGAGTLAAGNDSRIVGAAQNAAAAITGGTINGAVIGGSSPAAATFTTLAATGLTLGTPLPLSQGGCGATSALGCLTNLGIAGGTAGQVLTSNGLGTAPTYQAASTGSANAVLYTAQSLTSGQQDQVRANISGPVPSSPSTATTLATTDIDRPISATGTTTITAANGGAGWRTGPIANANAVTGLVTLAVPSGATLDGTSNGTTVLFPGTASLPGQKARILQTGATAYVTDWITREPIIANGTLSAASTLYVDIPAGYSRAILRVSGFALSTAGPIGLRVTNSGSGGLKAGASDYYSYGSTAGDAGNPSSATVGGGAYAALTGTASLVANSGYGYDLTSEITPGASGLAATGLTRANAMSGTSSRAVLYNGFQYAGTALGRINGIQLYLPNGGTISGSYSVTMQ